jgi:hypothetical protein
MCSMARPGQTDADHASDPATTSELADRLGQAIDELAAISADDADRDGLAERLAGAWALVAQADPDLAARAARYRR